MKKITLAIMLFFITTISFAFHIMPAGFEKRIDDGSGYQEFYFPNNSNKNIRYKFDISPGSERRGDMSQWVEIYPKILTVKPKETGILKVYAKSPNGIPDGEYGFFLTSTPITIPTLDENGKEIAPQVSVKIVAKLEMVGYVGNLEPKLSIEKYSFSKDGENEKLELTVKNDSIKRGVDYIVEIKGKNKKIQTVNLGRVSVGESKKSSILLKGMKSKDVYEIKLIEDINYKEILKLKI